METVITLYTSGRKEDITDFDKLRTLVSKNPAAKCRFQIIDVFKYRATSKKEGIVVIPTITCESPNQPTRKVTGSMKNPEKIAFFFGLPNYFRQKLNSLKPPRQLILS